jgi:amidase
LVAHGWDSFLKQNADPKIPSLTVVDGLNIFPQSMRTKTELEHLKPKNAIHWDKLTSYVEDASEYDIDGLADALATLEDLRRRLLDDYLTRYKCDGFVFPAASDVGPADADVNYGSAS